MLKLVLSPAARRCMVGAFLVLGACAHNSRSIAAEQEERPAAHRLASALIAQGSLGHRIEIETEASLYNRATATLTLGDQTWRVRDTDCPRFRSALDNFQRLPTLRPGPGLLQPGAAPDNPMSPAVRDGESWTIWTEVFLPNWSSMKAELNGTNDPYSIWMSQTVQAIKACGPPISEPSGE